MGHRIEDGVGGETRDEESIESLLRATDRPTEEVVDVLRESGLRRHVSDTNVDDILADVSSPQSTESSDEFALSGEPTRTVSTTGIDEVFETLEAEAPPLPPEPEFGDSPELRSVRDASTAETRPGAADTSTEDTSDDDSFGTLAGGGPTRTVSDQSVDDILELVEDDADANASETEDPRRDASELRPEDPEAELVALLTGDEPAGPDDATTAPPEDDEPSDSDASRTNSAPASSARDRRDEPGSGGDGTRRLADASGTAGSASQRDSDDCGPDVNGRHW